MLGSLLISISLFSLSFAGANSVCEDVYPHLSFGIGYEAQDSCEAAGGCWDLISSSCYFPKINGYQYTMDKARSTGSHLYGTLSLIQPSGALGPDFKDLTIEVITEKKDRMRVKIYPNTANLWEVPQDIIARPQIEHNTSDADLSFLIPKSPPFELVVQRGKDVVFLLSKMIVFQEQYLQVVLGSSSDVQASFGYGESTRDQQALKLGSRYTLWNTDYWAGGFEQSLYGSHPLLMQVRKDGSAHGSFFMNSNAMELSLFTSADKGDSIGIQSAGGIIDFYIFSGPTPADVVRQYQELVGKPAMIPYWSLGFHNCRWGYKDIQQVKETIANYSAAGIPLETQWVDIDYMDAFKDFTVHPTNFPLEDMRALVGDLHAKDQRFVPIVDPGIYAGSDAGSYPALVEGLKQDVFIKDLTGEAPYLGQVWPGPTYFPDWFAPNATDYWKQQLQVFHDLVPYDGIWIDMNEVSNFCNARGGAQVCQLDPTSECPDGCCLACSTIDSANKYDFPPWTPHVSQGALGAKTVAMSTLHAGNILEYNAHSLYGLMESKATHAAVGQATGQRPFVLSRSTFASSGMYTAHWTGDNCATWEDLKASLVTMNNLALFGQSMTGADICGFAHDSNEELCARWIEVGAFSPFSRNHNELGTIGQELYVWPSVARASKTVLAMRYSLLPHLYTLMYQAHTEGATVMNAMWMHFPSDPQTFSREEQYMWGDSVLFTPVMAQGATSVTGYFPAGVWYSLFDAEDAARGAPLSSSAGTWATIPTPMETTNAHVRGGSILPMQGAEMTTTASRKTPFSLLVALDSAGTASGELFLDDGVQRDLNVFRYLSYTASADEAKFTLTGTLAASKGEELFQAPANLERVEVLGLGPAAISGAANARAQLAATFKRTKAAGSEAVASHAVPTQIVRYVSGSSRLVLDLSAAQLGAGDAFEIELVFLQHA